METKVSSFSKNKIYFIIGFDDKKINLTISNFISDHFGFKLNKSFRIDYQSSSLRIVFVNVDCYIHNLDQTILFLAICNSSIGNFCFILPR